MESAGQSLISQLILQERSIRDSRSAAGWDVEFHKVTLNGSGVGTIYTMLDKITMVFVGGFGTGSSATMPMLDDANKTYDSTTELYSITINGTASTQISVMLVGKFEGA